jgi:hypothetical protein
VVCVAPFASTQLPTRVKFHVVAVLFAGTGSVKVSVVQGIVEESVTTVELPAVCVSVQADPHDVFTVDEHAGSCVTPLGSCQDSVIWQLVVHAGVCAIAAMGNSSAASSGRNIFLIVYSFKMVLAPKERPLQRAACDDVDPMT